MQDVQLPYDGTFYYAKNKKFSETIFFVHFYEGSKLLLKRHIELVNELGFDAFAFNLLNNKEYFKNPISRRKEIGIKHVYSDQIEFLLNAIAGKKIIFAFSNPSASAIEAMYLRHCSDTTALICDSGPSGKFVKSFFNLFRNYKENNLIQTLAKSVFVPIFWSRHLHKDVSQQLASFPKGFPILSIRGWKDDLIPPDHIDSLFEGHPNLSWRKLSLPQAGHLNGLKDFRENYTNGVRNFLLEVATPIS